MCNPVLITQQIIGITRPPGRPGLLLAKGFIKRADFRYRVALQEYSRGHSAKPHVEPGDATWFLVPAHATGLAGVIGADGCNAIPCGIGLECLKQFAQASQRITAVVIRKRDDVARRCTNTRIQRRCKARRARAGRCRGGEKVVMRSTQLELSELPRSSALWSTT